MILDILFQDDDIVVVNKPAGLLVHRTELAKEEEDAVVQRLRDQTGKWVFPVHRLDRATSGVLIMAFSPRVASVLAEQFANGKNDKIYHCLVRGFCPAQGEIDYPLLTISEPKGMPRFKVLGSEKEAQTEFELLEKYQLPYPVSRYDSTRLSWLKVMPKQGRKHQIRRHFKHELHPLVGDTRYGCRHINKVMNQQWPEMSRLMLHASSLTFAHPITHKTMTVQAPFDTKINTMLMTLRDFLVPPTVSSHAPIAI